MAAKDTEHIKWIDGLKGLACIGVLLHHFFGTFYPAYHTGNPTDTRLFGIDSFLCNSPVGIIINGNFWVCIFLAISAYVLSIQIMKCNENELRRKAGNMLIKRYFRLAIPMVAVGIIDYLTYTIVSHWGAPLYSKEEMSFVKTLFTYAVSIWVYPDANVFAQLWTMHYLFRAAFVVVLFTIFDRKETKFAPFIYVILIYPLMIVNECYISIMMGIILADLTYFERGKQLLENKEKLLKIWNNNTFQKIAAVIFMVIAIYMGGYPSNSAPCGVYVFLLGLDNRFPFFSGYMHGVSSFFFIGAIFLFTKTKTKLAILEGSFIQKINKYSLAIYMLHGFFIIYFCQPCFAYIMPSIKNYNLAVLITFILTVILTAISSVIFNITVERFTGYIVKKING